MDVEIQQNDALRFMSDLILSAIGLRCNAIRVVAGMILECFSIRVTTPRTTLKETVKFNFVTLLRHIYISGYEQLAYRIHSPLLSSSLLRRFAISVRTS